MQLSGLKQRVVSAIAALAALAILIKFLPKEALIWVVLILWIVGAWEWSGFIKPNNSMLRSIYTLWLGSMMLMIAADFLPVNGLRGLLVVALLFWLFSFVQILRYPVEFSKPFTLLAGVFALIPSYAAFDYLLKSQDLSLWYVLFLLVIIWAADVGAYFTGKALGKNKLAPKVSPGKTREGAAGGWVFAIIFTIAGGYLLFDSFDTNSVLRLFAAGTGIFFLSVVGDLTMSMFKRNVGLKDSGVFLPGHGGVLDRIDSWTSGVVLYTLIFVLFH